MTHTLISFFYCTVSLHRIGSDRSRPQHGSADTQEVIYYTEQRLLSAFYLWISADFYSVSSEVDVLHKVHV